MAEESDKPLPKLNAHIDDDEEYEQRSKKETTLFEPASLLAKAGSQSPYFVVVKGRQSSGNRYALKQSCTIGRALGNDIELSENGVSRRHAVARLLPENRAVVEDLGSSNGLYFQGERRERLLLSDGDRFQVGDAELVFLFMEDRDRQPDSRQSTIDTSTGLPNRRQVLSTLASDIQYAESVGGSLALLLLEVDQFHSVGDEQGITKAQAVLKRIAHIAEDLVRGDGAYCGKFAEDTLAVILPDGTIEQGARTAEWMCRSVEAAFSSPPITVSIGVATWPDPSCANAQSLVEVARRNLCQAVLTGRNRVAQASAP